MFHELGHCELMNEWIKHHWKSSGLKRCSQFDARCRHNTRLLCLLQAHRRRFGMESFFRLVTFYKERRQILLCPLPPPSRTLAVLEPQSRAPGPNLSQVPHSRSVLSRLVQLVRRQEKGKSSVSREASGAYLIVPPVAESGTGLEADSESHCTVLWQSVSIYIYTYVFFPPIEVKHLSNPSRGGKKKSSTVALDSLASYASHEKVRNILLPHEISECTQITFRRWIFFVLFYSLDISKRESSRSVFVASAVDHIVWERKCSNPECRILMCSDSTTENVSF